MDDDVEYYARREAQERQAATHARSPEAEKLHNMLADRYANLARSQAESDRDGPGAPYIGPDA